MYVPLMICNLNKFLWRLPNYIKPIRPTREAFRHIKSSELVLSETDNSILKDLKHHPTLNSLTEIHQIWQKDNNFL